MTDMTIAHIIAAYHVNSACYEIRKANKRVALVDYKPGQDHTDLPKIAERRMANLCGCSVAEFRAYVEANDINL